MDDCRRIALYSHDALGLGHLRRNLVIARALAEQTPDHATLLVTGAREAGVFPMPPGTDCLALPALTKADGDYRPRSIGMSLDALVELRAKAIASALKAFEPDVFIVDKRALGIRRELRPSLDHLRAVGNTRLVLGLRDVLDAPSTVEKEWSQSGDAKAIGHYYDAVWVYGDPHVYDVAAECDMDADVQRKVRYSGYLVRQEPPDEAPPDHTQAIRALGLQQDRFVLCLVGGGQDGYRVAETFARTRFPAGMRGVILTGPFMPLSERQHLLRISGLRSDMEVLEFIQDPTLLIRSATSVVAMGGYNTTCELLAIGKPALIVPRTKPRREQLIRAQCMNRLGLVDMIPPHELSPRVLGDWMAGVETTPRDAPAAVDLDGVRCLPRLLDEVVNEHSGADEEEVLAGAAA